MKWTETRDCTKEGSAFWGISASTGQLQGSFDSLHINIFSNNIRPLTPYPVMVFIHEGLYSSGSSSVDIYGPDFIIEKDVTLVSFNFRLGAFGYLSLDDAELGVPGNAGFKDQRMALQWIQVG